MPNMQNAARAYETSSAFRTNREQEADLFRRANAALRLSSGRAPVFRVRALADNARLWTAVIDTLRDPENALPEPLKASIVSVGLSVLREMQNANPEIQFLLSVNENFAAGLSSMVSPSGGNGAV